MFFYNVEADGLSLDDKRQQIEDNDLPDVLTQFRRSRAGGNHETVNDRSAKAFVVPAAEIRANKYDLSINRYHERAESPVAYEQPRVILARMKSLENVIQADLSKLETLV